jgi:cytidylate kinase
VSKKKSIFLYNNLLLTIIIVEYNNLKIAFYILYMKIAISGKMCSGKSTLANMLIEYFQKNNNINFIKYSFANGVYEIAKNIFYMKNKDRKLLQQIGEKMREIDKDIWIKKTINDIHKNNDNYVIIDDLRFINELEYIKKHNFFIIRLNISKDKQHSHLITTYPTTYQNHIDNLHNISEIDLDNLPHNNFDIIINTDNYTSLEILNLILEKLKFI